MRPHTTQGLRVKIPAWYLLVKRGQGLWFGLCCFRLGGRAGWRGRGVCFQDCHSQGDPRSPSEGLGALPCTLGSHRPSYTVVRTQNKEGPFERTEMVIGVTSRIVTALLNRKAASPSPKAHSEETGPHGGAHSTLFFPGCPCLEAQRKSQPHFN